MTTTGTSYYSLESLQAFQAGARFGRAGGSDVSPELVERVWLDWAEVMANAAESPNF